MPITATRTTTFRPGAGSDQDNDGFVDIGDILRHTLVINNTGDGRDQRRGQRSAQRIDADRHRQRLAARLQRQLHRGRQHPPRGRQRDHPDRPAIERRRQHPHQRRRVPRRHLHHLGVRRGQRQWRHRQRDHHRPRRRLLHLYLERRLHRHRHLHLHDPRRRPRRHRRQCRRSGQHRDGDDHGGQPGLVCRCERRARAATAPRPTRSRR